ncbi:hypothetical protein FS749_003496, partial [Ceratobasidium sp. UAMH 11750]
MTSHHGLPATAIRDPLPRLNQNRRLGASSLGGIQYSGGQWNENNSWYSSQRYDGTYHNAEQPSAHFALFR